MLEEIDHIVYAVNDLSQAVSDFQNMTGLKVSAGGQHLVHGTHNALIRIGERTYLEFIAKDPSLTSPSEGTWMGLDLLEEEKITRWSLGTSRITEDAKLIKAFNPNLGIVTEGSRVKNDGTLLQWQMSNVLPAPEIDAIPFLLDWGDSVHPTEGLALECGIIDFKIITNSKEELVPLFDNLGVRCSVESGDKSKIELILGTPKGHYTL